MKNRSLLLALFAALLSLPVAAGCNGQKDDESVAEQRQRMPAYFEEIPADTFFFMGGSEPVPRDLVEKTLSTADTMWQWSQMFDDGGELGAADEQPAVVPAMAVANPQDQALGLLDMLSEQMGGEFSVEGLEELGLAASPRIAAYSVGTVPVLRVELSDAAKFNQFVDRLEQEYGLSATPMEHAGESYRRYGDPDEPFVSTLTTLRVTDDEAIIASVDADVYEIFEPYFVGAQKPAQSLADDNAFVRTAERHGFQRYGAGFIDLERAVAYLTGAQAPSGITAEILQAAEFTSGDSQECQQEMLRLVRMMPRMVAGFRHFDQTTTDFAVGAELEESLARGLQQTVDGTPGYNTAFAEQSLLQIGLGVNAGKMIDFLAAQSRDIQAQPFQCRSLQRVNQSAAQLVNAAGNIPPALRSLAGFNLLVRNVGLEWQTDTTVLIPRMLAAVRTDQPEALMYLVAQVFPMASQIQAQPDGEPVLIPQAQGIYEGIVEPSLLMTQRGLALLVGPQMADDTRSVLDAEEAASAPAMVARLNLGDPAREMLDDARAVIDQAEADMDARGLSDEDIAGARRAVASIEEFVPGEAWAATFTTEFTDLGVLFSYRDQGALDFDPDELPEEGAEQDFDALERVLGGTDTAVIQEQAPPLSPNQPAQPVRPEPDTQTEQAPEQ